MAIDNGLFCSFCGVDEKGVDFLVEGNDVYICDNCIARASDVVKEKAHKEAYGFNIISQKPKEIKTMLMKLHLQNLEMMLVIRVFGELHFI